MCDLIGQTGCQRVVVSLIHCISVIRMDHIQKIFVATAEQTRINFKNAEDLIRPVQLAADQIKVPVADFSETLCFVQAQFAL